MTEWFTSDTHFGHANIIKYVKRPFANYREMDEAMITNWNAVVGEYDTVYHMGDFAYGRDAKNWYIQQIAQRLNGQIKLILGNHDKIALSQINNRFASIKHYEELDIRGQRIVLFHYGLRTWHHDLRGAWHLYGHSHGGLPPLGKSLDIGVDAWDFTPVNFTQLRKTMDNRAIGKHPEFQNYDPKTMGEGSVLG